MVHPSRKSKLKHAMPMVMKVRETRLPEIIDIISHQTIRSQEELSKQLAVRGYIITQATLSRDLKLIKASKVPDENGICRYVVGQLQGNSHHHSPSSRAHANPNPPHSAIISVGITGNLLVIKTRNGYASGLAYDIDMLESPLVLGTIPGADTVFVALREGSPRKEAFNLFSTFIPMSVMSTAAPMFIDE